MGIPAARRLLPPWLILAIVSVACLILALTVSDRSSGALSIFHHHLHLHPGSDSDAKAGGKASSIGPIYWWVKPRQEAPTWTRVEPQDPDLLPSLSPAGKKIRRVLIYSLVGGTCRSDDWRGDLPRYLIRYLADARAVMIDASPSRHRNNWACSECRHDTDPHFWDQSSECEHYFGKREKWSKNPADMVVVFGAGSYMPCGEESPLDESCKPWRDKSYDLQLLYPDLYAVFTSGLVTNETLKIHIPIRKTHYLNEHPIFPFHHILVDNEFLKPLSDESFANLQEICEGIEKGPVLIYIGRFTVSKGQLAFLEAVDPKQLDGYTVHFHGSSTEWDNTPYFNKMSSVAKEKGIDIVIHPPMEKEEIYSRYCRSAGQIHYSHGDNNPRAVYEGLSAENPVFTTYESNLHSDIYQRSFVVSVSAEDKEIFDSAFEYYMYQVRNPEWVQPQIKEFVHDFLRPGAVYTRLCGRLGLCGDSSTVPSQMSLASAISDSDEESDPGQE